MRTRWLLLETGSLGTINAKRLLTIAELHNALEAVRRAYVYVQRVDWLLSDDDGEDDFHERLKHDLENFRFDDYYEPENDD
ncbi:MAG: hypothetical protein IKZ87_01265 [Actinomycetaceae bacterium]|nr:hypothetical protein [Actinomycetaceae bacterium]